MAAGDVIVVNENTFGRKGNLFDGVDDYALHDAHAVARVAANDTVGTYTAWIYSDIPGGSGGAILSAGDNNSATEYLYFVLEGTTAANMHLRARLVHGGASQWDIKTAAGTIQPRTWTHVAVVQNATRPTLYINGVASAMTDTTSTDLTDWYAKLTACDKFAIGVKESNATHTKDFKGAIGRVQYFNIAMTAAEMLENFNDDGYLPAERATAIEAARVFDISMEDDGTTDSGSGADNGTLTGGAFYGGMVSDWSYAVHANVTGHAAEDMNTIDTGREGKFLTLIKRGD